jgi:hypothetical protein
MPIRISDLVVGKRELTLAFGTNSLKLTYDPNKLTAKMEAEAIELRGDGRYQAVMAEQLSAMVVGWDLQDEDGKPLPPSKEIFLSLGYPVMVYLTQEISSDFFTNPLDGLKSLNI